MRPAGQDEPAQRRQLGFEPVDQLLEPFDVLRPAIAALVTRAAMRERGSASRAPSANRSRWIVSSSAREIGIDCRRARPRPGRRSARRPRRRRRRADRPSTPACCRTATSRPCRRSWCRSARVKLYGRAMPTSSAADSGRPPAVPPRLLAWYRAHGRDLPWRQTSDPYHILVSEMMLQQTQVDRVLPKYHEWLDKYPSLEALAAAPEDDVVADLVSARLQHPAAPAAGDRARIGRPLRRPAAVGRGDAAARSRASAPTPPARSAASRSASARRSSTPTSRACCFASSSAAATPRRTRCASTCGTCREALRAAQARLRLQPGADGLRRDGLHGAQAEVPDACPMKRAGANPFHRTHER